MTRTLLTAVSNHLPDATSGRTAAQGELALLTERERESLVEVAHGRSNAEVAFRLVLSEATVKSHVGRVLMKLGLRDRAQIVVWANRNGVVRPDDPDDRPGPSATCGAAGYDQRWGPWPRSSILAADLPARPRS